MRTNRPLIRAFLVDDEEPARRRMRSLLTEAGGVEVVGEAGDGDGALEGIKASRPDLVFLDIQMPGLSGLEVASLLEPPRPQVVFCTAFDRYALQAFEMHALDYLLKPVNRSRLQKAMERVRRDLEDRITWNREVERASNAQSQFFPQGLPQLATLDFFGCCRPARWVSGDYYDFIALGEGKLGIVVADVSGKGMAAGLFMAGLQGRLQSKLPECYADLPGLVSWLNQSFLRSREDGRFITLFLGVYDEPSRMLRYVNAGHLSPFVVRQAALPRVVGERLETGGPVLGLLPDAEYQGGCLELAAGDLLAAFTDGITEAGNPGEDEFGEDGLIAALCEAPGTSLDGLAQTVFQRLGRHGGSLPAEDDQTLVLLRGR